MEADEIIAYLREWLPGHYFMRESREGLARELASVVTEDPGRFSPVAERFTSLHPIYVRSLISGVSQAVGKKKFAWQSILNLCTWVLEQKDDPPLNKAPYWVEEDKDWGWTRTAIAHLLESALTQGADELPFDLRDVLWVVLRKLSDDPNPTPEDERRYLGSSGHPFDLAINATRGVALLATTHYAPWVRRHLEQLPDGESRLARGFAEMPEVREALEKHLDPQVDPSLAARSVYGARFPWIQLVNREWASGNAERIFPSKDSERQLWEAAWDAYIGYCDPYDDVLAILMTQYRLAVQRLGAARSIGGKPADQDGQLAAHLISFYWRGKLSIDGDDRLLADFFAKASGRARAYALECIGRWLFQLKQSNQAVDPATIERLVALWEWRAAEAKGAAEPDKYAGEAASFGWWFRSEALDSEWAIARLEAALEIATAGHGADLQHASYAILESLASASIEFPLQAVRCLERLYTSGRQATHIFLSPEHVRPILSNAIRRGGEAAQKAETLINEPRSPRNNDVQGSSMKLTNLLADKSPQRQNAIQGLFEIPSGSLNEGLPPHPGLPIGDGK